MSSPRARFGRSHPALAHWSEPLERRVLLSAAVSATAADTTPPSVTGVSIGGATVVPYTHLASAVSQATVTFSENLDTTGGPAGANSVTNPANWGLMVNAVDVSSRVSAVTFGLNPATQKFEATVTFSPTLAANADYVLITRQPIRDVAGNGLDADGNGTPGGDYWLPYSIRQPAGNDPEFRANATTTGDQTLPAVATNAAGAFVVTWLSSASGGRSDVYARLYDSAGVPRGDEFRVSAPTAGGQSRPVVAMDADGNFVVVWPSAADTTTYYSAIYARRYNAAGVPLGEQFLVSTDASGSQAFPAIAMNPQGNFVVTWSGWTGQGQYATLPSTYARRFDAAGVPQGTEFIVNTVYRYRSFGTTVTMDNEGNFLIAWAESSNQYTCTIYARRYTTAGIPSGDELKINSTPVYADPISSYRFFSTGMDATGNFVVVWNCDGPTSTLKGVFAQRYNAAGSALGDTFRVNPNDPNYNSLAAPAVAMDSTGTFAVVWNAMRFIALYQLDIYMRRYDSDGTPLGDAVPAGTTTFYMQKYPAIAANAAGDFVLAWATYANVIRPGDGYDVLARRYGPNRAPTSSGVSSVNTIENGPPTAIDLWPAFTDSTDASPDLLYSVVGDTNPALFSSVAIDPGTGKLNLAYAANAIGAATLTVRATDTGGLGVEATIPVAVRPAWLTVPAGGQWAVTGAAGNQTLTLSAGAFAIAADPAALNPGLSVVVNSPATLAVRADVTLAGLTLNGAGAAVTFYDAAGNPSLSFSGAAAPVSVPLPTPEPAPVPRDPPQLAVGDVARAEGNAGTAAFAFPVTLDRASDRVVRVSYSTANAGAAKGSDYAAAGGVLVFRPGETRKTITVQVKGDAAVEADERFRVELYAAAGATIADGTGVGTIKNDDAPPPPRLFVGDAAVIEGDHGRRAVTFDVTLDRPAAAGVTVKYATADGTARAGSDYQAAAGSLTFKPGETRKRVTVYVNGDKSRESDETFFLDLSVGAGRVARGRAVVRNDDR